MNVMISTSDAAMKTLPASPETISYGIDACALGHVLVARSAEGVCAILLGSNAETLAADLAARFPAAKLEMDATRVHDDLNKVARFIDRPAEDLDLPLDLRGTSLERQVWETLRKVPVGTTVSYAELARRTGGASTAQTVAAACAANPIALAVPCHRVIRSDGSIAGYRWGVARKRALIAREATA